MKEKSGSFREYIHSMRLHIVMIVLFTGVCCGCAFFLGSSFYVRMRLLSLKNESVADDIGKLTDKMARNAYTAAYELNPDIGRELQLMASFYDGRITVTDVSLMVIFDSYGLEDGKYLISTEAIQAVRGQSTLTHETGNDVYEQVAPIYEIADAQPGSTDRMVSGVVIVNYSVVPEMALAHDHNMMLTVLSVMIFMLISVLGILFARRLTEPLNTVTQTLDNVSEGYNNERVDLKGYTEIIRISDSINNMLERMDSLENSRKEFVSNVSHELKTPIASIKVLSDSLLASPDAPIEMYREFMADINTEIDREATIINDLLALSKLEDKNSDMHIALVSINELLELLLKRLKPIAGQAGVEMIFESYREVEAEVDEVKLTLALSNIIENAIKYNKEKGTVKIFLNSDHKYFIIRISDTGIGIPQTELEHIFDRFYRVDKMRSRETGGTGLGLAITKSIVLMHHGTVRVESVENEGASFTVRIPLKLVPEQ
ncbi:MAG: HAMP domain-containing histidine kinase [Lachnospiraceae bacterium]|nr:HAMP domain-containing histidine kinase [Lachnospiraceae bacterium]